jgi:hypothetical protein
MLAPRSLGLNAFCGIKGNLAPVAGDTPARAFIDLHYCCFGAAVGLAVSEGIVLLVLLLVLSVFDFAFFFGAVGSAAGA